MGTETRGAPSRAIWHPGRHVGQHAAMGTMLLFLLRALREDLPCARYVWVGVLAKARSISRDIGVWPSGVSGACCSALVPLLARQVLRNVALRLQRPCTGVMSSIFKRRRDSRCRLPSESQRLEKVSTEHGRPTSRSLTRRGYQRRPGISHKALTTATARLSHALRLLP